MKIKGVFHKKVVFIRLHINALDVLVGMGVIRQAVAGPFLGLAFQQIADLPLEEKRAVESIGIIFVTIFEPDLFHQFRVVHDFFQGNAGVIGREPAGGQHAGDAVRYFHFSRQGETGGAGLKGLFRLLADEFNTRGAHPLL